MLLRCQPCPAALSGFADRIDHRRRDRLSGRLAAPRDELECRIEALAFRQGDIHEILDLFVARCCDAAQQHRVSEGRRVVLRRKIKMPEPKFLVSQRQELVDSTPATLWDLHVEPTGEVHRTYLLLPHEIESIIAPATGNLDNQLLLAGSVMRPVIGDDNLFDKVDGISREW